MPPPVWPPNGAPTFRLAISVVTLLSPNVKSLSPAVLSKKFGAYPKSTSKPSAPAPIHESCAPKFTFRSNSSSKSVPASLNPAEPPQFMPTNGVNSQSAEAFAGAAANAVSTRAVAIASLRSAITFLISPFAASRVSAVTAFRPAHDATRHSIYARSIASDVPQAHGSRSAAISWQNRRNGGKDQAGAAPDGAANP